MEVLKILPFYKLQFELDLKHASLILKILLLNKVLYIIYFKNVNTYIIANFYICKNLEEKLNNNNNNNNNMAPYELQ